MLFSYIAYVEGLRGAEIVDKVKQRVPEAFAGGCVFWPLVNVVNFALLPATMRVPYLATAGTVWNTFLSFINANDINEWLGSKEGSEKEL